MAGIFEVVKAMQTWRRESTYTRFYLKKYALYHKEKGYFSLPDGPLVLAQSVVSERSGLLEPPRSSDVVVPSGATPSGSREPKDKRSKVKSSSRSRLSQRFSSPALF